MSKRTSIEAYNASKEYQITARYKVLKHLYDVKGWRTSEMVSAQIVGVNSGIRTRLRELEDMGLVVSRERGASSAAGNNSVSYAITEKGVRIVEADNVGRYILRASNGPRNVINEERAQFFAPYKEQWDDRVAAHMAKATDDLMNLLMEDPR